MKRLLACFLVVALLLSMFVIAGTAANVDPVSVTGSYSTPVSGLDEKDVVTFWFKSNLPLEHFTIRLQEGSDSAARAATAPLASLHAGSVASGEWCFVQWHYKESPGTIINTTENPPRVNWWQVTTLAIVADQSDAAFEIKDISFLSENELKMLYDGVNVVSDSGMDSDNRDQMTDIGQVDPFLPRDDIPESAWWSGANVPCDVVSEDNKEGETHLKVTFDNLSMPADMEYPNFARSYPGTPSFADGNVLSFWYKSSVDNPYVSLALEDADGTLSEVSITQMANVTAGEWKYVEWHYKSNPGWVRSGDGQMDYENIRAIRGYLQRTQSFAETSDTSIVVEFDDMRIGSIPSGVSDIFDVPSEMMTNYFEKEGEKLFSQFESFGGEDASFQLDSMDNEGPGAGNIWSGSAINEERVADGSSPEGEAHLKLILNQDTRNVNQYFREAMAVADPWVEFDSYDTMSFWLKTNVEDPYVTLYLYSDDVGWNVEKRIQPDGFYTEKINADEWHRVTFDYRAAFPEITDWSKIRGMGIGGDLEALASNLPDVKNGSMTTAEAFAAGQAITIEVDDFSLQKTQDAVPQETLTAEHERIQAALLENLGINKLKELVDTNVDYTQATENGRYNIYEMDPIDGSADGYIVERKLLRLYDDVYSPVVFFRPSEAADSPRPTILYLFGHGESIGSEAHVFAIRMAKKGYNVCMLDTYGQMERSIVAAGNDYHGGYPGARLLTAGIAEMGVQMLDAMQAVSYISSRSDVDTTRLGVTGGSGGGQQSMLLTAIDDRIDAAALSSTPYVCAPENFLAHFCTAEGVPNWATFTSENYMLAALAPKPILRMSGAEADSVGSQGKFEERHQFVSDTYAGVGAADRFVVKSHSGTHGYSQPARESAYGFFDKFFLGEGDGSPIAESGLPASLPKVADYKAYQNYLYPIENMTTTDEFRLMILNEVYEQRSDLSAEETRAALEETVAHEVAPEDAGIKVLVDKAPEQFLGYTFKKVALQTETGIVVPMLVLNPGQEKSILMLDPDSKNNLLGDAATDELLRKGYTVVLADLRGTGETWWASATVQMQNGKNLVIGESGAYLGLRDSELFNTSLMIGKTTLGMWNWDANQIVSWLKESYDSVSIYAEGDMGIVATVQGALNDDVDQLVTNESFFTYRDEKESGTYTYKMDLDPRSLLYAYLEAYTSTGRWFFRMNTENMTTPYIFGVLHSAGPLCYNLLSNVGDVADIAALAAPKTQVIIRPRHLDLSYANWSDAASAFATANIAYMEQDAQQSIQLSQFMSMYGRPITMQDALSFLADVQPSAVQYDVTISPVAGGSAQITASPSPAAAGETVELAVSALEDGKKIRALRVETANGTPVPVTTQTENSLYTFEMPDSEVLVTAELEDAPAPVFDVNVAVTGGTADVSADPSSAGAGETVTLAISNIPAGKAFDSITVTGATSGELSLTEVIAGGRYTFVMPGEAVSVSVSLKDVQTTPDSHMVTLSADPEKGTVSGGGSFQEGDTVRVSAAAKEGFRFDGWKILSGAAELADASAADTSFLMTGGDVSLEALFTAVSVSSDDTQEPASSGSQTGDVSSVNSTGTDSGSESDGSQPSTGADAWWLIAATALGLVSLGSYVLLLASRRRSR